MRMVVSIRRWFARLKFFIWLILLTYAVYYGYHALTQWMEPLKYRELDGGAVKVFEYHESGMMTEETLIERLRLFYWVGE
jgi:hypothetical protein